MTQTTDIALQSPSRARALTRAISARGLWFAMFGAAIFLSEIAPLWSKNLYAGVLPFLLFVPVGRLANRYYERRFGWFEVEPEAKGNPGAIAWIGMLLLGLYFFRYYIGLALSVLADYFDNMFSTSVPLSTVFWDLRIRLFIFLLLALSINKNRDWQKTRFLIAVAALLTLIGMLPLWFPECKQSLAWRSFAAGYLGLSVMALGLYDHIRLLLLLPRKVEAAGE